MLSRGLPCHDASAIAEISGVPVKRLGDRTPDFGAPWIASTSRSAKKAQASTAAAAPCVVTLCTRAASMASSWSRWRRVRGASESRSPPNMCRCCRRRGRRFARTAPALPQWRRQYRSTRRCRSSLRASTSEGSASSGPAGSAFRTRSESPRGTAPCWCRRSTGQAPDRTRRRRPCRTPAGRCPAAETPRSCQRRRRPRDPEALPPLGRALRDDPRSTLPPAEVRSGGEPITRPSWPGLFLPEVLRQICSIGPPRRALFAGGLLAQTGPSLLVQSVRRSMRRVPLRTCSLFPPLSVGSATKWTRYFH